MVQQKLDNDSGEKKELEENMEVEEREEKTNCLYWNF